MSYSQEIRLKEEKNPSIWKRFLHWLDGEQSQPMPLGQQLPKTGTNTEILLSQTQKIRLEAAVDSPHLGRTSDTTSFVRRDSTEQSSDLII